MKSLNVKAYKKLPRNQKINFWLTSAVMFAAVTVVIWYLSSPSDRPLPEEDARARVSAPHAITAPPGTVEVDEHDYDDAVTEYEQNVRERRRETGASYMPPTRVEPAPRANVVNTFDRDTRRDRLQRTAGQEPRQTAQQQSHLPQDALERKIAAMAEVRQSARARGSDVTLLSTPRPPSEFAMPAPSEAPEDDPAKPRKRGILPGDILIGYLKYGLNSDTPTPAQVVITDGPLTGARLTGNFAMRGERLVVEMSSMVFNDELFSVNAVLMDPEENVASLQGEINRHILLRYGSLWAYGFMSGARDVLAADRTETTVVDGTVISSSPKRTSRDYLVGGLGVVGDVMTENLRSNFQRPPTVTVPAGEMVGVLFGASLQDPKLPNMSKQPQY